MGNKKLKESIHDILSDLNIPTKVSWELTYYDATEIRGNIYIPLRVLV